MISVVIPYFETGPIVNDAIYSCLNTSFVSEIVVVDDCSVNFPFQEVVNNASSADGKIKIVVHEENRGLPAARNSGALAANGEYLLFLDSDDQIVQEGDLDKASLRCDTWFYSQVEVVTRGRKIRYETHYDLARQLVSNKIAYSILIPKALLISVGMYDEQLTSGLEDWDLNLRLGALGARVAEQKAVGLLYRRDLNGMLMSKTSGQWMSLRRQLLLRFLQTVIAQGEFRLIIHTLFRLASKPVWLFQFILLTLLPNKLGQYALSHRFRNQ